jgi:mRNA interferase MazF
MTKGDIVLIPFPFTDLSGTKKRPALILAAGESDITVSFITTQFKWEESHDIRIEPSDSNGLKKISLIRISKLATIDKDMVIGKLGYLSLLEVDAVNKGLIALFNLKPGT